MVAPQAKSKPLALNRPGVTSDERDRLKALERENRELKRGQRDPAQMVELIQTGESGADDKQVKHVLVKRRCDRFQRRSLAASPTLSTPNRNVFCLA